MFKLPLSVSVSCIGFLGLRDGKYRYCLEPNFQENLKEMKRVGIDAVELCVCGFWSAETFEEYAESSAKLVVDAGLKLNSVHFPFGMPWIDLACPWEADRLEIIKWCAKMFSVLDAYAPKTYVFHPGGEHVTKENYKKETARLCDTVTQMAKATRANVCVENMAKGELMDTAEKTLDFALGAPTAGVTLDVNHLLHDKPEDAIAKLGKYIRSLHISDYDFINERHMMPKEGKIDWMKVLAALDAAGIDCAFNYELSMTKYGYTYAQVKENYEALFAEYNRLRG